MTDRFFLHIDMNAFFASCEVARNPELKDKPIAVIAGPNSGAMILSANYIARGFGIYTTMASFNAKKLCKELITIRSDHEHYRFISQRVMNIIGNYSLKVEVASIDEAYIEITNIVSDYKQAKAIAKRIQMDIYSNLYIECSIGISYNKYFAKIASDLRKPNKVNLITSSNFKELLWDRDLSIMPFIGKKTIPKMKLFGINTVGDLANFDVDRLINIYGKNGKYMHDNANGINESEIEIRTIEDLKSISNSRTFSKNIHFEEDILSEMYKLFNVTHKRLIEANLYARTVNLSIRFSGKVYNKSKSIDHHTQNQNIFITVMREILLEKWDYITPIEFISTGISNLITEEVFIDKYPLLTITEEEYMILEKNNKIRMIREKINEKWRDKIVPASKALHLKGAWGDKT